MPGKKGTDYVDLRSPSDLPMFNKLIDKFSKKGIYILVHADFCGPCQHYKKTIWNDLVAKKDRTAGMAAIHHDQLENSPFANANIKGYPSVIYVTRNGTIKKVSNFNDSETGSVTNAMPSSDMRNKELMEKLVNSTPEEVQKAVPSMEKILTSEVQEDEEESSSDEGESLSDEEPEFSPEATSIRNNTNAEEAVKSSKEEPVVLSKKGSPPKGVVLDTMDVSSPLNFNPQVPNVDEPKTGKGVAVGGSLYSSLISARRKSRGKKSSRSTKRKTKRVKRRNSRSKK